MTETKLITREELLIRNFNDLKIDVKDVKKFLIYFVGILQLGISKGLIDEAGRNIIANAITNAIELKISQDDDDEDYVTNYVQIRNYMYIISSYLQSKSNWDAWLELSSIKTTTDAFILIDNAKSWAIKKIKDSMDLLASIKLSVVKLDINNVTNTYQILVLTAKNAMASTSNITKFDLQDYHNMGLSIGTYILMKDSKLQIMENFFVDLSNTIYHFCMEVSILFKIDAKKLVESKKGEVDAYFNNLSNQIERVNCIYKNKFAALKKEYQEKAKNSDDKIKVDMEYSTAKFNLEKDWEKKLAELDNHLKEDEISQMEILNGEYSLCDLIKEYAIYEMALKGKIYYPSTTKERSVMLMMIDNKQAISEFLLSNEHLLTNEQIEFLKKIA